MSSDDRKIRPNARQRAEEERLKKAGSTLSRVEAEAESLGTSSFARVANRAKDHLAAEDIDPHDPVEVWGTRIGRFAGAIFAIILILWLINHFTR